MATKKTTELDPYVSQMLARGQYDAANQSLKNLGISTGQSSTGGIAAGKTAKDLSRVDLYDFLQKATPEEREYFYGYHYDDTGKAVGNGIPQSYVDRYIPQTYAFWNAGRSTIGDYGIDDSNTDTWKRIAALYNSGDTNGAYDLINALADKGKFGGYYDDNGQYWGFAQGYLGGANSTYLPVVGGTILSNKGLDTTGTNIWLTPDGKALHADANGALSDTGDTWSKYANTDIARTQLKMLDDADASLKAFREQNGGRYPEAPDPVPNGNGGLTYTYGGGNGTIYQQALGNYPTGWSSYSSSGAGAYTPTQPQSYEQWSAQNGSKAAGLTAPGAYDPESDTMWQKYLKDWANKQAPEYAGDPYQAQRDAALAAYGEKWGGSEYQPLRDQYLQNAANMKWSYNPDTDPVWQAYQKQYRREGQRATEDTLGRVAGMTGGMPSSYAVTAASQAGNYYASQLSDKLPQLYQDAYNRYLQEYQRQLGLSDAYAGFDNTEYQRWLQGQQQNLDLANAYNQYGQLDYQKYLDQLGQFNTDRNFNYNAARDNQQLGRQSVEDQYKRYLDALSQANYEDETAYSRYRDTISDQRYDQEWAQKLREYADSQNWKATEWQQYLREYGDKLSQTEKEWVMEQAQIGAKYGDYSGLSGLGIDTSSMNQPTYAYSADGTTYDIGSYKGKTFIESAPAGSTMTGGDGSKWTKNADGSVTIQKNGKTFTYGQQTQPAQSYTPGKTPAKTPPTEEPLTEEPAVEKPLSDMTFTHPYSSNWIDVGGTTYTWPELRDAVNSGAVIEYVDPNTKTIRYERVR